MTHALTSSAACTMADTLVRERAGMGAHAKLVSMKRKSTESFDLVYCVEGANGRQKNVVVSNRSLKARLKAAGVTKQ